MIDFIKQLYENDEIHFFPFTKNFNSTDYDIGLTIFHIKNLYQITLSDQSFKKLVISNSIDTFYPYFELTFIDTKGVYASLERHVGEYIRIYISEKSHSGESGKSKFDLIFSIQSHKITNYDRRNITYTLSGKLYTAKNFGMHINYATTINQYENNGKSPFQIIKDLLQEIKYPIKSEYLPATLQKIFFITDQNATVEQSIKYCLNIAATKDLQPIFLYHNLQNNEPQFVGLNFPKKIEETLFNMQLQLPSLDGTLALSKYLIINNVKILQPIISQQQHQQRGLDIGWEYDHIHRRWNQDITTPKVIDTLLTIDDKIETDKKSLFYKEEYAESYIRHYRINQQFNRYNKFHDLVIGTNNIQFDVCGNLLRDAGQKINISCNDKNFVNVFGGTWKIYSIVHTFQQKKEDKQINWDYNNNIIGFRTFNLNHSASEDVKNEF